MSKIGFVVPVYKIREDMLRNCVDSLINQTYQDIEIILVDDCSPDDCGKICEQIKTTDSRIKVFHHEVNKGLPSARNTGIENSEAEYLAFVDSDDWVESNMAEILVGEIEKNPADVYVYSGFRDFKDKIVECAYIYEHGKIFQTQQERDSLQERYLFDQTTIHVPGSFPIQSACARLVSKKLFDEGLRFVDVKFAEDALFHLYSNECAQKVIYLQYRFYHYRDTNDSMVNSYRPNADAEQTSVLKEMWKFAETYQKNDIFIKGVYLLSYISMQMCVWQKFYNEDNPDPLSKRKAECRKLFSQFPYKGVLKKVDFRRLRKNQKIKYTLMRLKAYGLLVSLREKNKVRNHREAQ